MKSAFKDEEFVEDLWKGFIYGKSFTCTVYDQKSGDYVGYCAIKDIEKPDWELADEFGVKPEEMLGKVLEYQLDVKE